jgi:hypothetical protein
VGVPGVTSSEALGILGPPDCSDDTMARPQRRSSKRTSKTRADPSHEHCSRLIGHGSPFRKVVAGAVCESPGFLGGLLSECPCRGHVVMVLPRDSVLVGCA